MSQNNKLAVFLKEKREKAELSQKDVATKLGYSTPQFISNWERGISYPPINIIKKLAEIYQVSSEEIFEVTLAVRIEEVNLDLRKKFKVAR